MILILEIQMYMAYSLVNGSIIFLVHENAEALCQILGEILTIFDFCSGHFEFCLYKILLTDDRVSLIGFVISRVQHTR